MTGHPSDPESWNKYPYTEGDPINFLDPSGAYQCGAPCSPGNPTVDWSFLDNSGGGNGTDMTAVCATVAVYGVNYAIFFYGIDPSQIAMDCDGGGVGGGGGQPQAGAQGSRDWALNSPFAANPNATKAWALVGYETAMQALPDPACNSFIADQTTGVPSPAALLTALWNNGSFTYGYIADGLDANRAIVQWLNASTNAYGPCANPLNGGGGCTSVSITLNTNASTPDNFAPTAQAWAVTLLHELGHAYFYIYGQGSTGLQYDGNGSPAGTSEANTANVIANCFK